MPTDTVIEATKLATADEQSNEAPDRQRFTYVVVLPSAKDSSGDRRANPRQRTRLRSAKIADRQGRFVTECLMYDLSPNGSRLRHPANVVLPASFQLYDDQSGTLYQAIVLWRRGGETGIRFDRGAMTARGRATASGLRRRFYAVPG